MMIFQKTSLTLGDQSGVWRSFSLVVWFVFRRLIGWWRLESGHCKQRNWSQVLPVYLKPPRAPLVSEDDDITRRGSHRSYSLYQTAERPPTRQDLNLNRLKSWKKLATLICWWWRHRPQKRPGAPDHIVFQTSDDPAELRVGSSGVRGIESLRLRPQQLRNQTDEPSVSDLSCERSL